jgi:hypothetical protein
MFPSELLPTNRDVSILGATESHDAQPPQQRQRATALLMVPEINEEEELPALNSSCKQHNIRFLRAGWLNIYI